MKTAYAASIEGDALSPVVTVGCKTAKDAAKSARRYAKHGEKITVIGPRGGVTIWEAVGPDDCFGNVWKL